MPVWLLMLLNVVLLLLYIGKRAKLRRNGPFLVDIYIVGLMIYTVGILYLYLVKDTSYSERVALIVLTCLFTSLIASILFISLAGWIFRARHSYGLPINVNPGRIESSGIKIGMLVCSAVMIIFLGLIMSNEEVRHLIVQAVSGTDGAFLDARKSITSGQFGYFAPGFIKQFRDVLAPIILAAAIIQWSGKKWTVSSKILFLSFFVLTLFSMLLTGQRLILVILFLTLLLAWHYSRQPKSVDMNGKDQKREKLLRIIIAIGSLAFFYIIITIMLGRTDANSSIVSKIWSTFAGLIERVFLASPRENSITFPFWSQLSPTYGASWLAELGRVLPGVGGEGLSNKMHQLIGGSAQGNSPLGLAPDIWLAWGWTGLIIVPIFYSFGVGFLDLALSSYRSPLLIGAKLFLVVSIPIMYSPYGFILYGGAAVCALFMIIALLRNALRSSLSRDF